MQAFARWCGPRSPLVGEAWALALVILLGVFLGGVFPATLPAQATSRETQIPLAPEAGVLELSAELRSRLGLFPEVPGFVVGRLLEREDGTAVFEIEARAQGRLTRERRDLTAAELQELRALVSSRIADVGGPGSLTREGRGGLVLGQTLVGVAFHGWAVPFALGIDSAQGAVAAYLLTAGANFFLPYRLTRERAVSDVHRDLTLYGATRGILYGVLAADALIDDEREMAEGEGSADRTRAGAAVAASVAGSLLGFVTAERSAVTPGTASLWAAMGDIGLAAGATAGYAAGPYAYHTAFREDLGFEVSERRNVAAGHLMTMAGGALGMAAGRWMGARAPYTRGNVHALRSATLLGAHVGVALTRATGTEHNRSLAAGGLAGAAVGVVLGDRFLRSRAYSSGEGLLLTAGHLAGGATALGLTYLIVEDIGDHDLLYLTTGALGSFLGVGLVYRALGAGSSDERAGGGAALPSGTLADRGLTVHLHPHALILARSGVTPLMPLVSLRF